MPLPHLMWWWWGSSKLFFNSCLHTYCEGEDVANVCTAGKGDAEWIVAFCCMRIIMTKYKAYKQFGIEIIVWICLQ